MLQRVQQSRMRKKRSIRSTMMIHNNTLKLITIKRINPKQHLHKSIKMLNKQKIRLRRITNSE